MKIDRLMGIVMTLLQNEKVTAPELAEKFEVSRRTINRDIEELCRAGIPIVTLQGAGGGISVAEGYSIDRRILSDEEVRAISAGLLGLDSVSGDDKYKLLRDKLFSSRSSSGVQVDDHMMIDLSSWYKSSLTPKIALIREAIDSSEEVSFTYYSAKGEQIRRVQPYLLMFRWASWYLWGYCLDREAFRMFKLNRMDGLRAAGRSFERLEIDVPEFTADEVFPVVFDAQVLIEPEMKWRLIEEFGTESFREREDGRLLFSFGFRDRNELFSWVLSFGDKAELISPDEIRTEFGEFVARISRRYSAVTL